MFAKEKEPAEEAGEEEASLQQGLSNATAKRFDEFSKTLSTSGKFLASLIAKTHCGVFDDEFRLIANAEYTNPAFSFPWSQLFSPGQSEKDEKV